MAEKKHFLMAKKGSQFNFIIIIINSIIIIIIIYLFI